MVEEYGLKIHAAQREFLHLPCVLFTVRDETPGMVILMIAVAPFGTVEIAGKCIGPQHIDPLMITFIRFILTGIVLLTLSIQVLRRRMVPSGARDLTAANKDLEDPLLKSGESEPSI